MPESLGNLTALTFLHLNNNQLTAVPESLGNLTALTYLDLRYNQLTAVPDSLRNLTTLTNLWLSGNPLPTKQTVQGIKQTVQGILILSRAPLARADADRLLRQIIEQQRSTWGRAIASDVVTHVQAAGQYADNNISYAYATLREAFPGLGLGGEDAFSRILKFDAWKGSDGNTGTYYIVVDRP